MKVLSIVGARPQFVKAAPVTKELRKNHEEILIHTGQHYNDNMSKVFFDELYIPQPDYNLAVGSGSHAVQTGKMLEKLEEIILNEHPDMVIVYGDTNSTLSGALATVKLQIPLIHIEAGLRSFNREMPEEINRVITDHVSTILFAPTQTAVDHLSREGITRNVVLSGDVMYDAILDNSGIADEKSNILSQLKVTSGNYLLATIHRPANADNRENLESILEAFAASGERIIFPAHPRTQKLLLDHGLRDLVTRNTKLHIVNPLGYLDFLKLEKNARIILTDSGGIQKEAFFLKVPCVTMRTETEWVETVDDGWNIITGSDTDKIISAIKTLTPPETQSRPFGDGRAAVKIVAYLEKWLEESRTLQL